LAFNPNSPGKSAYLMVELVNVLNNQLRLVVRIFKTSSPSRRQNSCTLNRALLLVTQQPLRGRSKQGGQRVGEMYGL
jgi:hypothetical protein